MAGWTCDEDAVIRAHAKTQSAAQIAKLMPGRSRAAIVGRAWRLGISLAKDETTKLELEHPRRRRARRTGPPTPPPSDPRAWPAVPDKVRRAALAVQPRLVRLEALRRRECRWPYGDADIHFCGRRTDGGAYCDAHRALASRPAEAIDADALAAFLRGRDRVAETVTEAA